MKKLLAITLLALSFPALSAEINWGYVNCPVFKCKDEASAELWFIQYAEQQAFCPSLWCPWNPGDTHLAEIVVNDREICVKFHYRFEGTIALANRQSNLWHGPIYWANTSATQHCTEDLPNCGGPGGGN